MLHHSIIVSRVTLDCTVFLEFYASVHNNNYSLQVTSLEMVVNLTNGTVMPTLARNWSCSHCLHAKPRKLRPGHHIELHNIIPIIIHTHSCVGTHMCIHTVESHDL